MATYSPIHTSSFTLHIAEIDVVGVFFQCSGIELSYDVFEYREGGNNQQIHRLPGGMRYPNLVLSRGLTDNDALMRWFNDTLVEAKRKEVRISMSAGDVEKQWTFADGFPVRWTGPSIEANGGGIATESLEIAHGGLLLS